VSQEEEEMITCIKSIKRYSIFQLVSTGFMYARKKGSGLGLPWLPVLVSLACLKAGRKLLDTENPLIQNMVQLDYFVSCVNVIAGSLCPVSSSWPLTLYEFTKLKFS
jgi:hypothetical protein